MNTPHEHRRLYGRGCDSCSHTDAGTLDALLAQGGSVTELSQRFGLSRDSIYRHLQWHLRPALAEAAKRSPEIKAAALVERVASIANDARDARKSAYAVGNSWLGARLGAAELQALTVLAERFRIDHDDAANDLAEAASIARVMGDVARSDPALRDALAAAFDRDNRPDLAEELRALPIVISENSPALEVTP